MLSNHGAMTEGRMDGSGEEMSWGEDEGYSGAFDAALEYPPNSGTSLPSPQTPHGFSASAIYPAGSGISDSLTPSAPTARYFPADVNARRSNPLSFAGQSAPFQPPITSGSLNIPIGSGGLAWPASGALPYGQSSGPLDTPRRAQSTSGMLPRSSAPLQAPMAPSATSRPGSAELLDRCADELQRLERETNELNMLLAQDRQELAKFTERKQAAQNVVEEMEAHLEHYARQQIRSAYLDASEAEMGVFMLTEHIEHLEGKVTVLERYARFLSTVLAALRGGDVSYGARPQTSQPPSAPAAHQSAPLPFPTDGMPAPISAPLPPLPARPSAPSQPGATAPEMSRQRHAGVLSTPVAPDEGPGLVLSIRNYTAEVAQKYGVDVNVLASADDYPLPLEAEVALFRVLQEAVRNAVHAGQARTIHVSVDAAEGMLRLLVEDDGCGFDVQAAVERMASGTSRGLARMHRYAEALGGQLTVESGITGSRVGVSVPLA